MEKNYILTLPVAHFVELIAASELNISDEFYLIEVVRQYIQQNQEQKQTRAVEAKDIAGPVVWGLLSEAEQKARNTAQATANKAIKDKQDKDDKEKYTDAFHKIDEKDEDAKIHFVLKYRQDKRNQEIKDKLYPVFLTGQDRYDIFKSIRWSRLQHEQLIELTMDPIFAPAKEMILAGLSARLSTFEHTAKSTTQSLNFSEMPPRVAEA